ncbi:MAG: hypothetical protein K6F99_06875 [Lachnospiraceae bacterium]|nr:hypothetical protein [Lachnospiraceae bacterium]
MITKRLFDDDPYMKEFTSEIVSSERNDNKILLVLKETAFFPEEGGQEPDNGEIEGFPVIDVQISDDIITHVIDDPDNNIISLQAGNKVFCRINWAKRFSNMQNHTGEHILSGILHRDYSSENVGFHLSSHIVTLDTSKNLTQDELDELEIKANKAVYANIEVRAAYYSPEEAQKREYRSKKEIKGDIRIVDIEGVDSCACCAPHVTRTGEIGLVKIVKAIKYKGGSRLTILCGERAFLYVQKMQVYLNELSQITSESMDNITKAVETYKNEIAALKYKAVSAEKQELMKEIEELPANSSGIVLFKDGLDKFNQREGVNRLVEISNGCSAIFNGNENKGFYYIIGTSKGDARELNKVLSERFNARGGGSKEMVQGSVSATEIEITNVINEYNSSYL